MKKLSEFVTKNKMKIGVLLLCFMVLIVACIHYANNNKQIATITTPEEQEPKAQQETVPAGYTAITTAEQLATVRSNLSGKYILMADIDMTDVAFTPIGQTSSAPFKGTFDGNYHKISNLKIESANQYVGMFGYINGGTVKNLTLENVNIKGSQNVGGLVGYQYSGAITNVGVTGEVSSTGNSVGGLTGSTNSAKITNAYSAATVTGTQYIGGLIGNQNYGSTVNTYATGTVAGTSYVGGLVGTIAQGTITNSYTTGEIKSTGTSNVGGLVGYNNQGTATSSYWSVDQSGQLTSAGGEGKFFSVMLKQNAFTNWDFENVWQIEEGATLPYLRGIEKPEVVKKENYTYTDWEGEGTEENPYLVKTAKHLKEISNIVLNAHYKLANDIDMTDEVYEPIGTNTKPFAGTFDGNNHKISNLKIESENQYVGMFGYINGGTIKNILLENVNITGTNTYVGGLVGQSNSGTITNVGVTGKVTGTSNVGGLVGYSSSTTITNAYSTATVTGTQNVGGLIGNQYYGSTTNAYVIGKVSGTSNIGGLVGYNNRGTATNSYWAIDTTKQATSALGEGKFFNAMLKQETFTNWDFETVWQIEEGATLPYIKGTIKPVAVKKESYEYADWEGEGTEENPYLVKEPKDLRLINYTALNAYYKLANDIDMQDEEFEVIGPTNARAFTGTFDGNNHRISNLKIESTNNYVGMFGYINSGTVKNLELINVDVKGGQYVGGLVGQLSSSGTITNVGVTGKVVGTNTYVGGLIGYQYYGTVTNAYSTVEVSGTTYVGGLIGGQYYGTTTNTYAVGRVTATGTSQVGGLLGYNNRGTVNNSYWATDTTKQVISATGTAKVFSDMLEQATFTNWDFETVWQIEEGTTLPYLKGMAKPEAVKKENYEYVVWEGVGTEENPYLIKEPKHLRAINYSALNAYYKLVNDIDMQDEEFEVIGPTTARAFTGTFDGNNHKISNLKIESANQYVGMFG